MIATGKSLLAEGKSRGLETMFLHAGDAITGTLYYTFFGPSPDAAVMNAAGYEVFVLGNHEFDGGDGNLANFTSMLNMPVISYNRKSR